MSNRRPAIFSNNSLITNSGIWDFHNENTQEHLHSLHPYPARFIPQIPRKAIEMWSKPKDIILDPFCGCGTTLLEGILAGRRAIGVDNNDVACLISKAKTTNYSKKDYYELLDFIKRFEKEIEIAPNNSWRPEYVNIEYWFDKNALEDLAKIKWVIDKLSKNVKLLVTAVFSSIIVRISNQDSDTRYARIEKKYIKTYAIRLFKKKLIDTEKGLYTILNKPKETCTVYLNDSTILNFISNSSIDLIITSPPYLNAYDYHKYHRHRLHWIKGDILLARDCEIGKHDFFTRPNAKPDKYFKDMEKCFTEWYRILKNKKYCLVVIGDAIVNKTPVPVSDKFIIIAESIGFICEDHWLRKLQLNKKSFNQAARIQEEHVLLFKKS